MISETIKEKIGEDTYTKCFMDMFPGSAQCTVRFPCEKTAQTFYESFPKFPYSKIPATHISLPFSYRPRAVFVFYSSVNLDEFKVEEDNTIPDASSKIDIPGLQIIPEFVDEEEEKQLLAEIDS